MLTLLENRALTSDLERSVSDLQEREEELQFQAFHDPLTALANRALFRDRLEHALEQRREAPISVLFVDLDDFKNVNDSLGHDAGDRLLVSVGERLRACVRPGDTVARLGGDEFAILVEGDRAQVDGPMLAQRVLAALAVPFAVAGRDLRVGASLGLATGQYTSGESALQDADLAMYAAKANGKARVAVFEHRMRTSAIDRLELVSDIRQAAEAGQLQVYLQPIVDLRTLQVDGHEALLRWQHPQRGLLQPASFMGLAEETGAIVPMGWWVMERACEQAAAWPDRTGTIGVNLAAGQLLDSAAVTTVAAILARTDLDPARLLLEITESVLLDADEIGHRLHQLRALGVRLAIDDFGTGYSSLSYLTRLPVDVVKIDRSFVERLGGPVEDELLVRSVVQLARSLGLRSVGEGVETAAQMERLRALGCDAGQGFLFGHPQVEPRFDLGGVWALRSSPVVEWPVVEQRRSRPLRVDGAQGVVRQVGSADQQIRLPRVPTVVAERASVESTGVQPGGESHRGRSGVVPLVLPAGVRVDVGLAQHHRHGLGPCGSEGEEGAAERIVDQTGVVGGT